MEEMQQLQQTQDSERRREEDDDDSSSEMEQDGPAVTEDHYRDGSDEGTMDFRCYLLIPNSKPELRLYS